MAVRKAFDKVHHKRLLKKLWAYGGRYKVRKEPSPAKRAEKMRKEPCFMEERQILLYHACRTKFRSH